MFNQIILLGNLSQSPDNRVTFSVILNSIQDLYSIKNFRIASALHTCDIGFVSLNIDLPLQAKNDTQVSFF
jgi:hypothetical protein